MTAKDMIRQQRIEKCNRMVDEFRRLCERYQIQRAACVIAFPCVEHDGEHADFVSMGESGLCEFIDNAILMIADQQNIEPRNTAIN